MINPSSSKSNSKIPSYEVGTFGYAVQHLQAIEGIEVLQEGQAMIAISGIYQGRVFTSSAKGMRGKSYGWFNQDLIDSHQHTTNIAILGGESRLWFAPEYGRFSLCFENGAAQVDANMVRPNDLQRKMFRELKRSKNALTVAGQMRLKNTANTIFDIGVERTITLLSPTIIEQNLGITISEETAFVGFSAESTVTNISKKCFQKDTGLIAIWELGCMLTAEDNQVIIPLRQHTDNVTEYFSTIDNDRLQIRDNTVFYQADALSMGKIGILPQFCKNVMGSYSPSKRQLNIVTFSFENDELYVNSVPNHTEPYKGDVINIFNGEVNEAMNWNLPFYEFESSSSAKELKPKEKLYHCQTTYHFEGSFENLNEIAKRVLGISLTSQ